VTGRAEGGDEWNEGKDVWKTYLAVANPHRNPLGRYESDMAVADDGTQEWKTIFWFFLCNTTPREDTHFTHKSGHTTSSNT
jgi:hypothetical protein